jgi:phage tail-like protein
MGSNPPRPYGAAHFALELDAKDEVGLFRSIEGGSIKTDVMTYQHGADFDRWRYNGKPKFEDIKITVGLSMSDPFWSWIEGFFRHQVERKNGAIIACDFEFYERARRTFQNAIIKEIVFPKLEGEDKNAVYMNVTMAVERSARQQTEGLRRPEGLEREQLPVPPRRLRAVVSQRRQGRIIHDQTERDGVSRRWIPGSDQGLEPGRVSEPRVLRPRDGRAAVL